MTKEQYKAQAEELLNEYNVPKKYRAGVLDLAWEEGHAYGYREVWVCLQDIVHRIFKVNLK